MTSFSKKDVMQMIKALVSKRGYDLIALEPIKALGGFPGRSAGRFSLWVDSDTWHSDDPHDRRVAGTAIEDLALRLRKDVVERIAKDLGLGNVDAAVGGVTVGPPGPMGQQFVVQLPGGMQLEDRAMTMSGILERVETRLHEAKEMGPRELIDKGDNLVKLLESAVEDVRKAVAAAQAELKGYARIGVPERAASVLLKKHLLSPAERLEDMAKKVRETIEEGIKVFS